MEWLNTNVASAVGATALYSAVFEVEAGSICW